MIRYFDTGVILKLYIEEPESDIIRNYVIRHKQPILFHSFHMSECVSAFRLKCFRRECQNSEAAAAILDIESDLRSRVLIQTAVDWNEAWEQCRILADSHAATTGCRTLDTLHVACAKQLGIREFVTTDNRQSELARAVGMKVTNF
jgi:predicted nucleic acid-binding protein